MSGGTRGVNPGRDTPGPRADDGARHHGAQGSEAAAEEACFGALEIDRDRRVVLVDGEPRPLTQHQFDLLLALAERPGVVLSRADLMDRVRGEELEAFDRSIDVHVSRIRAAIERDPANPTRILTLPGRGYLFTGAEEP